MDNFNFQKKYGQNFLIDSYYTYTLTKVAGISDSDSVIEIGTGLGALTKELVKTGAKVISIDIDKVAFQKSKEKFKDYKKVRFLNADVLSFSGNIKTLIHKLEELTYSNDTINHTKLPYKVVGSLPYNISKKIIQMFLEAKIKPITMTYIIQHEVAQDYASKPPHATFLSNYVRLFGECQYIEKVPKVAFHPIPRVDGAIIHFELHKKPGGEVDKDLIKFIKSGFSMPRKNMANILSMNYEIPKNEVESLLTKVGIDKNRRPAMLELEEWKTLYKALKENRKILQSKE